MKIKISENQKMNTVRISNGILTYEVYFDKSYKYTVFFGEPCRGSLVEVSGNDSYTNDRGIEYFPSW